MSADPETDDRLDGSRYPGKELSLEGNPVKVEWSWPGAEGRRAGGAVFSGCRVSLLQDEKHSGDGLYNHMNVPNTMVNCMICGVF